MNCGVKPHFEAVLTTRITLPLRSVRGNGLPRSIRFPVSYRKPRTNLKGKLRAIQYGEVASTLSKEKREEKKAKAAAAAASAGAGTEHTVKRLEVVESGSRRHDCRIL